MNFLAPFGINIKDKKLLETALTHSSFANEEKVKDYERLEFLGDAVLQIIISEYFYLNTDLSEGEMTKLRASYVCEAALAEYSKKIELIPFIRLGCGQKKDISDTIVADIFESVIGAVYLSNGIKDAKKLVDRIVIPFIKDNHQFLGTIRQFFKKLCKQQKKH